MHTFITRLVIQVRVLIGLVALGIVCNGAVVVAPPAAQTNEFSGYTGSLRDRIRVQEVYSTSMFPTGKLQIVGMAFRSDGSSRAFSTVVSNFSVSLATTRREPGNLSLTFAVNLETNSVNVFSGNLAVSSSSSGNPRPFDLVVNFKQAYEYDSSKGNLLVDIVNPVGSTAELVDGVNNLPTVISRVYNFSPFSTTASVADSGGDIIQLILAEKGQPLIQNGSFEDDLNGWTHDSSVVVIGPTRNGPIGVDGTHSADLGAYDVANSFISQSVNLEAGDYKLSYSLMANYNGAPSGSIPAVSSMTVSNATFGLLGISVFTNRIGGSLNGANGFTNMLQTFTVPISASTLIPVSVTFRDLTANNGAGVDVVIDNVVLQKMGVSSACDTLTLIPLSTTFLGSVDVAICNPQTVGVARYTIDGSDPTSSSPIFDSSLHVANTTTVKVRVFLNDFPISTVAQETYTRVSPIQSLPTVKLFTNSVRVTLTNALAAGVIRYTLDGSDPTIVSQSYTGAVQLTTATTIKAILYINGFQASDILTATYQRVYALNDGISPAWREQYFGAAYATDPRVAADADPDGDGATNYQEFVAGSNPLDPTSGFRVDVKPIPLITWVSKSNTVYRVLRKDSLSQTNWVVISGSITATNSSTSYVDLEPGRNSFYAIEAVR